MSMKFLLLFFGGWGVKINLAPNEFWTHDITTCPFFWEEEMPFDASIEILTNFQC